MARKAEPVWVLTSKDETAEAIAELGRLQRERQRIQADMNDEMAAVKRRHEETAEPVNARIKELTQGVEAWCNKNRANLLVGSSKTAALTTGEVSWRATPPKLVVRGKDAVLGALKKLGLDRMVRRKEEIDKEALLADPELVAGIKGLTIKQAEQLVIKPFETQLEEVAS